MQLSTGAKTAATGLSATLTDTISAPKGSIEYSAGAQIAPAEFVFTALKNHFLSLRLISSALTLWVSAPMEIMSTPVAAT